MAMEDRSEVEPKDYTDENVVVNFPTPQTHFVDVDITIVDDDYLEQDEHFYVYLHTPTEGALGVLFKALVIIKDGSRPGKINIHFVTYFHENLTKLKLISFSSFYIYFFSLICSF